ncbi:uncharacterized protein LOC100164186 isoform X1 [Acyrthosiphon pisum]|uniref:Macro domain-containing protein n=2 Tax=Acyrthosiphon pisum TaxID=7029 RepID=A0A8R2A9V1_ACYPI|nr:uncharacterized protein LOC100164186 isoform X1 [Acyrthosiphon pisum]XP_016663678.1 uncharacterized protein LOC100164186 isoform X1 [Acyrthosiphon pisum]|eukprot:XP_001947976.2 PREDICTED: uncharacterized protein LOC100164186 isoform X1 [Acyrthosiphon pisum]
MELKSDIDQHNIIEEVNIFLFDMPEEYSLGHCVAKDMRMSAGIAIYFKRNFGRVGELMDQRPNVGSVAFLQHNDRFIYYLVTKEFSNGKPSYNSITAAITKLRDFIVQHDVKKLAIPRIGCGLDKLDWSIVRRIIENLFQNVGCTIKICHFTHNLSKESELLRVEHPSTIKVHKNIKDIEKREFEKLNIILFSRKTTLPVYWDQHFQSVNEKYCFKSQYYKDYQTDLEVGQCLYYSTIEANIFVIVTNKNTTDNFSYQNLEKGLVKIKMLIENDQWHPTFIIHRMNNHIFEDLINKKIVSLICSAFLDLTPCLILQLVSSNS